ncbi:MAG: hemolysin family protein [Dehalococcoidia bacterium]
MSHLWELGLVVVLIAINAVFSGSEIALITLRPAQVQRLSMRGAAGRALARLAADPNRFLATIQVGITLAGFLASAAAAVNLAQPLVPMLAALGSAANVVAILLVTLALTFFTLVFGELAPKRIALQHPEGWAMAVATPLDLLASATRPVIWALSASTNLIVRLAGGDPRRQGADVTEEEIREMIATQVSMTEHEKQVITGALEVGDRTLREVVVPRHLVVKLATDATAAEALQTLIDSGHSRAPVYQSSPDDIVGVIGLRDLLGLEGPVTLAVSPIPAFPESAGVLHTLRDLQRSRQQMALVVNEHGGFEGIVTIEDLIEEIVGEIYDEYDRDIVGAARREDGSLDLAGSFPVHDLVDLGIEVEEGPYTTLAGFLLEELGHIPAPGEHVQVPGWRLTATQVTQTAIVRVHAARWLDETTE